MNIRYLTYFVEVGKEKNFTKAAKNLHLSQPALSKVIKNLENDLGVSLIDRSAKNFKLTDQGEILLENATRTLEVIQSEINKLYATIDCIKGKLVIGVPPVIGTIFFAPMISKFREKYPNINVIIIEEGANFIKNKLKESKIDIGMILLPVYDDTLKTISIANSENVLVVSKQHKLSKKQSVTMEELKDENFISLDSSYMLYDKLYALCDKAGYQPKIGHISSQWDFIIEMVSYNQGVALLPKPIVNKFHNDNVNVLSIRNADVEWNIGIAIKNDRCLSYATREFINLIKNEYKFTFT